MSHPSVPVIDVAALVSADSTPEERASVGAELVRAAEQQGFFGISGHGIDPTLLDRLRDAAAAFFALDDDEKDAVAMRRGGSAWRGWFPFGGELTSGVPDGKEGYYFGTELDDEHPAVRAGRPLHGPNLFPDRPAELGPLVLDWMDRVTDVGRRVLAGLALGLGLHEDWFDRWCADPTVLFRIFHYPPPPEGFRGEWGVAEHTDYGLLTLLAQDGTGGLEVRIDDEWVEVPPSPEVLVCNLGDMLERATAGRLRSTAHRVRVPDRHRYSFPLFLDPGWDAVIEPLPAATHRVRPGASRWDGEDVMAVDGPYGEYLLSRVARVFPELFDEAVPDPGQTLATSTTRRFGDSSRLTWNGR